MGLLVEGQWQDEWYDTSKTGGKFVREDSGFRQFIAADSTFVAAANRYHLYVSLACPWAHRTLIARRLKGLEDVISVSVVDPLMLEHGWTFSDFPDSTLDSVNHAKYLYEVYVKAKPDYTGRVTVPVLWDKETKTIVNNESAEIIRMFNAEFNDFAKNPELDLYPAALRAEIDAINERVYHAVNNGVYRCGFATTQAAYDEASKDLFDMLSMLEQHLSGKEYLVGDRLTEADIRLFVTLIRFDAVYVCHFKCNLYQIADYANLSAFVSRMFHLPGVAETVNFNHIKRHYFMSHKVLNPYGIIPCGPQSTF